MLRVGCSGWSYADWRGPVYPAKGPTTTWFAHYAARFDTVELNNTFYRLPPVSTVDRWSLQAPPGFVYAVKVGQFVTHRVKLKDPERWLANHLDRVRRLGEHLGPNLVQLPPRWHRDVARLDEFLAAAPSDLRWAVELRDPTWLHDDVLSTLERHRAALCIHDLLADHPWVRTADWTYVRFHGPHALDDRYRGRYTGTRLWRVAERLATWLDEGADVYAYFNNDTNGDAVLDATWLRDRVLALRQQPV
ncbi:MAG: DUF72 domain-containing protein [Acidobacteria bacterium]|nr:DUF72 domain-containing protein [Acidobacteriota bacterium]